jgi:DNA (cytosine-5)-methyltransferase 1
VETFIVAHTLKAEGHDASEDGTGHGVPLIPFVRATRPHGAHYGPLDDERWEEGDISPSLAPHSATQNAAVASTMAVRRLTPTECERLQGFPDGWTEGESDSARYRMLGNAVAVPVVEWIARRIVHVNG